MLILYLYIAWSSCHTCRGGQGKNVTVYLATTLYMVHLANIKFGKLECNANWQAFSLANRVNKKESSDYNQCWRTQNLATEAKFSKLKSPPNVATAYMVHT